MAAANGGRLLASFCSVYMRSVGCTPQPGVLSQVRGYAARRGTREKARKAKVKVEIKKVGFIPHNKREVYRPGAPINKRLDDSWKSTSPDNVWVARYYKWRVYSFAEAIHCHRETHHPTVLDMPDASVVAYIELNMQGAKKTRYVERFIRTVNMPHPFPQEKLKTILALCKGDELLAEANEAGATLAGGPKIIKEVMAGAIDLNNYDVVVAHPNILPELVALRGLLKKKYPTMKDGTLSPNISDAVKKFVDGVEYQANRDEKQQDFGTINAIIGTLDMDVKHLEANFTALLNDVNLKKPKRAGSFIEKTLLLCEPSVEKLKLDFEQYVKAPVKTGDNYEDEDEDEPKSAVSSN